MHTAGWTLTPPEDKQSRRSPDSGLSEPECEGAGARPAAPNLGVLSFGPEFKGSLQIVLGDPEQSLDCL